ncbi:MAG: TerB family tellurite resistance protein [Candidatus Lambdaproteobacteria bacterium]|nr:TerB family tellurite resistance protein [Candidatus Lambdaproteobacteria bacterium]
MIRNRPRRLPGIQDYSWQKRRDYLLLVAAVAAADGELHPYELELLQRWIEQFRLPPKSRERVLAAAHQAVTRLEPIERRLARTDLVYSLILDMMGMAMSDGVLMDDEIELLRGVAERLHVDPVDFNILIEFVHSAHQASQLANPEPLYEHAILSAFDLLRERKVELFAHTLLCSSSAEFDRALKERWRIHKIPAA